MRAAKRGELIQTVPAPSLAVPPVQSGSLYVLAGGTLPCSWADVRAFFLTLLAPSNFYPLQNTRPTCFGEACSTSSEVRCSCDACIACTSVAANAAFPLPLMLLLLLLPTLRCLRRCRCCCCHCGACAAAMCWAAAATAAAGPPEAPFRLPYIHTQER